MGRRGPAKKPTNLRILHGDEERHINRNEPQPASGAMSPPAELDEAGRAIWDYVVAELDHMHLANRCDRDQLHAYVEAVRLHAHASAVLHEAGPVVNDRGSIRINPAVRAQNGAARTMLVFAREFGLTPASRVHLTAHEVAEQHADRLLA